MNKINVLLVLVLGISMVFCDSKKFDIGEDLIDTQSGITIIDTFQVRLSTIKLDSVPTSGTKQLLCGKHSTSVTGSTEIIPYFNFDLGDDLKRITQDDQFDSITLELGYTKYYVGDTTQIQQFSLYQLTDLLDYVKNKTSGDYIYNNSSFPHEDVPLGTVRFYPYVSEDSVEFRLDDTFGLDLINMVLNNSDDLESNARFNRYLRGFMLKSASDSKSIIGFKGDTSGVKINIYTHIIGPGESAKKNYIIPLASEVKTHYNQAVSDRSNTAFAGLSSQNEEITARNSGNRCFNEGSAGIISRIDFPSLNDVFLFDDRVMIKAQLLFYPSTENDIRHLPQTLSFYESDKHNTIGSQLTTSSGTQQAPVQASLKKRDSSKELYEDIFNLYYAVDITEYLTAKFAGNYYNTQNGLLITIPYSDLQTSADLVILNGENNDLTTYRPQLQLYFLKYE
jgi:hypothetical protein